MQKHSSSGIGWATLALALADSVKLGASRSHYRALMPIQSQSVACPIHSQNFGQQTSCAMESRLPLLCVEAEPRRPCVQRESQKREPTITAQRNWTSTHGSALLGLCPDAPGHQRAMRLATASTTHAGWTSAAMFLSSVACTRESVIPNKTGRSGTRAPFSATQPSWWGIGASTRQDRVLSGRMPGRIRVAPAAGRGGKPSRSRGWGAAQAVNAVPDDEGQGAGIGVGGVRADIGSHIEMQLFLDHMHDKGAHGILSRIPPTLNPSTGKSEPNEVPSDTAGQAECLRHSCRRTRTLASCSSTSCRCNAASLPQSRQTRRGKPPDVFKLNEQRCRPLPRR